jgi:hypothetical protein
MPTVPSPHRRNRRALVRIGLTTCAALVALAPGPARAQAPCGLGNLLNFCVSENSAGVTDNAEAGDRFGAALAFGDFNGDGQVDLAVGIPGESDDAGAVSVFYAAGGVPSPLGMLHLTQSVIEHGDVGGNEAGDQFGFSLAAGDVDGDGYDDLVVGAPYEDVPDLFGNCVGAECSDVGVAHLVHGSATGLDRLDSAMFEVQTDWDSDFHFGYAVAVGLLSNDGFADIAIGSPGAKDGGLARYGRVDVFLGDPISVPQRNSAWQIDFPSDESGGDEQGAALAIGRFRLLPDRQLVFAAPESDVDGTNHTGRIEVADFDGGFDHLDRVVQTDFGSAGNGANDHFGSALAVGDFNGDHLLDLAIAAPDRDDLSANDSGRVYVAFGAAAGLSTSTFQLVRWSTFPGQTAQNNDRLGAALAAGDFDADGFDDLFLGAPGKGSDDRGFVYFVHGTPNGLVVGSGFNFSEPSLGGSAEDNAHFGAVLAVADIDGDGAAELAIGVPDKDVSGESDAGLVYVTRRVEPGFLFGDGFESGSFSLWSDQAP